MNFAPFDVTLRQLQYFVAVADCLSFRKAAALCRVAQPSLSAQLAQLEDSLGVLCFERGQGQVLLTAAGAQLLPRAKRLLIESADLSVLAKQLREPLESTVKLGVIPTISPYLLPSIAPKLKAQFPKLTVAWIEDKTEVLLAKLRDGEIDGAVLALVPEMAGLEHVVLAEDPFVLIARPDHVLAQKGAKIAATLLRGEDVMLLDEGHCFRAQALEVCTNLKAREGEFRATSLGTLVQMVAAGAGVTLLPSIAIATEAKRAKLSIRSLGIPSASRTLVLSWRKQSPLGSAMNKLAHSIKQAYPTPKLF